MESLGTTGRMRCGRQGGCFALWLLLYFLLPAAPALAAEGIVQLLAPAPGSDIIAKKPAIECRILQPYFPTDLVVLFDGTDISGVLDLTADGFRYIPVQILPAGIHSLSVSGFTKAGQPFKAEFAFSSRHFQHIEEAYTDNELTLVYDSALTNKNLDTGSSQQATTAIEAAQGSTLSDESQNTPYWKVESNFSSQSMLKNKSLDLSLAANLRYLDQQLSVQEPLKRGFDLIDYLLTVAYRRDQVRFTGELGDTNIDESQNTATALARRGAKAALQMGPLTFGGFIVDGQDVYGFDTLGLRADPSDHIMGGSGELALLDERVKFKTIYVTGGEEGSFFGTYSADSPRKGDVIGWVLTSDFFDQKLISDFEYDLSDFDADTTDGIDSVSDRAYRFKLGGRAGLYTYEALYEYMGPDYEVIGNQNLAKDKQGFSFRTGADFDMQYIALFYTQYHDNVKDDAFFPTIRTYKGSLEYTLNKFERLPISLTYEKALVNSKNEPTPDDETKSDTDTLSLTANYTRDLWSLGLDTSYSNQDDESAADQDTSIYSVTLSPSLSLEHLYVSTSLGYQKFQDKLSDVDTDTYTVTLYLQGDLWAQKITYDLGATYDRSLADDDSQDQVSFKGNGRLAYLIGKNIWGHLNPSVGMKVLYDNTLDKISGVRNESFSLMLTLEASIPFSY